MTRRSIKLLAALTMCGAAFTLTACEGGSAEKAGKEVDKAVEKAGEKVGDSLEKAGDAVKDATN